MLANEGRKAKESPTGIMIVGKKSSPEQVNCRKESQSRRNKKIQTEKIKRSQTKSDCGTLISAFQQTIVNDELSCKESISLKKKCPKITVRERERERVRERFE